MRLHIWIVSILGLSLFEACSTDHVNDPDQHPDEPCQIFTCTCLDSAGIQTRAVVQLNCLYASDSVGTSVGGVWLLRDPESTDRSIFPFGDFDRGELFGGIEDNHLWLTLTPGWCDIGFELSGELIHGPHGDFGGQWCEIGFAGPTDQGLIQVEHIGPCLR